MPRFLSVIAGAFILLSSEPSSGVECDISIPEGRVTPDGITPASDVGDSQRFVWVGSDNLAAKIPADGRWQGMGQAYNYRDKFWWWRKGYDAHREWKPELTIVANRLDQHADTVAYTHATNAFSGAWNLMLHGMEFPSDGCWEVIGEYHGRQLRFVFEVGGKPR